MDLLIYLYRYATCEIKKTTQPLAELENLLVQK